MQMYNVELMLNQGNKFELQNSIESILEILMALNKETVEKWIKEKYPNGIGLYEVIDSQPVRKEPSHHEPSQKTPTKEIAATFKGNFSCAICISTSKPVSWCEVHERFECNDCHTNERLVKSLPVGLESSTFYK